MAHQLIYKDLGIEDEGSYGASVTGTAARIHVASVDINQDPTKEVIEDTTSNVKGRDRIIRVRNVIEGSISAMGTPRIIHQLTELVQGVVGAETAVGNSATLYTYNQNTTGSMLSKTINMDRNNSQEKFQGVVGREIQFTASDNKLEVSLDVTGKSRVPGVSMSDSYQPESNRPYIFADFSIVVGSTLNSFTAGVTTMKVSEWTVTYNNDHEVSFLSGDRNAQRVDPKVPSLTGSIKIFHDNAGFVDATFGASEFALRLQATGTGDNGLIAGATPTLLRIDIPRAQFTTNVRNYEQAELSVEEIEFTGLFESGASALWTVTQTADNGM